MKLGAYALAAMMVVAVVAAELWDLDNDWNNFKGQYGKVYKNVIEEQYRKAIYFNNKATIEKHNELYELREVSFRMGINTFADMHHEEFLNTMITRTTISNPNPDKSTLTCLPKDAFIPDTVDWRDHGYVTDVQDQGTCKSSWTFSALGSLEGQHFKVTGKLIPLSPQNLVDCSRDYGNKGCSGGSVKGAFDYIIKNKGVDTEDSYQYEHKEGSCRYNSKNIGATLKSYCQLKGQDEVALKKATAIIGPISATIDASQVSFQFYDKGVYYESNCNKTLEFLLQSVLVVGYGVENGTDYWLVKNSWGTTWGNKGYILMSRNHENNCGIATEAMYPKV